MDARFWFRPKKWGYGAVPVDWRGWVAVGIYLAVLFVATLGFIAALTEAHTGPAIAATAIFLGFVVIWTLGFLGIARARTDGDWAWRPNADETGPAPLRDASREPADGPDATNGN